MNERTLRAGCELGVWLFLGYALQVNTYEQPPTLGGRAECWPGDCLVTAILNRCFEKGRRHGVDERVAVGFPAVPQREARAALQLRLFGAPTLVDHLGGRRCGYVCSETLHWLMIPSILVYGPLHVLSACVAVAGTWLLANDGHGPSVGDAWSVAAAGASAAFILRLEALITEAPSSSSGGGCSDSTIENRGSINPWSLTASSTATVAVLALAWTLVLAQQSQVVPAEYGANLFAGASLSQAVSVVWQRVVALLTGSSGWAVAYLGVVVTALTTTLQTAAQVILLQCTLLVKKNAIPSFRVCIDVVLMIFSLFVAGCCAAGALKSKVGAERAALVYALDPVWASFFANVTKRTKLIAHYGLVSVSSVHEWRIRSVTTTHRATTTDFFFAGAPS